MISTCNKVNRSRRRAPHVPVCWLREGVLALGASLNNPNLSLANIFSFLPRTRGLRGEGKERERMEESGGTCRSRGGGE